MSSLLNPSTIIQGAYDESAQAIKVIPSSFIDVAYDYVSAAYPQSDTEVYTYKTGGSGGTTVATVTVVYTDSTKENLSSVTKA